MRCADCRDLLNVYFDGELMPEEASAVRDHVAQCSDCTRALESLTTTSRLLQQGLVQYPAPDVLKARIRNALVQPDSYGAQKSRPASSVLRWIELAAAGIVIAIASSAATFAAVHQSAGTQSVADEVLTSHVRSLMPGHLIDIASSNQHNVKPWFNGRIDLSPPVPGLDSAGFPLVGGRLDYMGGHPVAAVVYSRRQHIINVYSWPDAGGDRQASLRTARGYHIVNWRANNIAFWVVSDLNSPELSAFASLFRRDATEASR